MGLRLFRDAEKTDEILQESPMVFDDKVIGFFTGVSEDETEIFIEKTGIKNLHLVITCNTNLGIPYEFITCEYGGKTQEKFKETIKYVFDDFFTIENPKTKTLKKRQVIFIDNNTFFASFYSDDDGTLFINDADVSKRPPSIKADNEIEIVVPLNIDTATSITLKRSLDTAKISTNESGVGQLFSLQFFYDLVV